MTGSNKTVASEASSSQDLSQTPLPSTSSVQAQAAAEKIISQVPDAEIKGGINRILSYINKNPHRYTDNVGAVFLRKLNDADKSGENATAFFKRFAEEGFGMEFTEVEEMALRDAGKATSSTARIKDTGFKENVKSALFNRRQFLRTATTVVGLSAFQATQRSLRDNVNGERVETMQGTLDRLKEKAVKQGGEIDLNDLLVEEEKARQELQERVREIAPNIKRVQDILQENSFIGLAVLITVMQVGRKLKDAHTQSREKMDQIITELDGLANYKLHRTPHTPENSRPVQR